MPYFTIINWSNLAKATVPKQKYFRTISDWHTLQPEHSSFLLPKVVIQRFLSWACNLYNNKTYWFLQRTWWSMLSLILTEFDGSTSTINLLVLRFTSKPHSYLLASHTVMDMEIGLIIFSIERPLHIFVRIVWRVFRLMPSYQIVICSHDWFSSFTSECKLRSFTCRTVIVIYYVSDSGWYRDLRLHMMKLNWIFSWKTSMALGMYIITEALDGTQLKNKNTIGFLRKEILLDIVFEYWISDSVQGSSSIFHAHSFWRGLLWARDAHTYSRSDAIKCNVQPRIFFELFYM